MKRALIFAAYVAIAAVDVALGQSSTHVKTETVKPVPTISAAMTPTVIEPLLLTPMMERPLVPEKVVMTLGQGGSIAEHQALFAKYRTIGAKVELRGPCYSACTIITTYVKKQNLCIAEGAFMAFHAARVSMDGPIDGGATLRMFDAYPAEIRVWIDMNGGVGKLPRDGYWTMYDRQLWAMGYPRCAP